MQIDAPERHGFDAARLRSVDSHLKQRYIDTGLLANAQLLVSRGGEIVHFSSQGVDREGSSRSIDESSIFRIASMTKPITSVGFMMLVEQNKVALDTPVANILPEFANTVVSANDESASGPPTHPMRMVDLLRHTSGLTYGFQHRTPVDEAYRAGDLENWHGQFDLDGFTAALADVPLEFSPGTAWNYSVSTDVIGAIIQRISGQPLDEYLKENILDPLGMFDTSFVVPDTKADRLTDCFMWDPKSQRRVLFDRAADSLWRKQPKLLSGGAGLTSTALDYHRFCLMCANNGELDGQRIIGRKTLDLMTMNHLPGRGDLSSLSQSLFSETQNAGIGFGLGFAVTEDPARAMIPGSAGEYYWGGMFSTSFFIDPVENLHAIFMTQLGPSWTYPIRRELKTLIYSALV